MKKNKGITLVALVVTIVVLLILAGVSINLVLGNNGIIAKAKEAETKSAEASQNDLKGMNGLVSEMEGALAGNGSTGSGNGGKLEPETVPYLPSDDFHYDTSTSVDTGLVIQDASGNEYVWVVVPRTTAVYATTGLGKTTFTDADYRSIETDLKNYTSTYVTEEGYSDVYYADDKNVGWFADETAYNNLKNSMLKSVYENGGFYVGRYEAGIIENRTGEPGTNSDGKYTIEGMPAPLSKADAYPYTWLTRTQAQNLAQNVNSGTKASSLMFGIQWDLVVAFMSKDAAKITSTEILTKDSTTIGNYYNSTFDLDRGKYAKVGQLGKEWNSFESEFRDIVVTNEITGKMKKAEQSTNENAILLTTGGTEQSKIKNIYDIAGNVWEWTIEYAQSVDIPCTFRAGSASDAGEYPPVAYRENRSTDNSYFNIGFRVSIF